MIIRLFKKREPLGYIVLFLNTGYDIIPNTRCAFGKYKQKLIAWRYDKNYWYQTINKRTIPLYKKDVKILLEAGFDINNYNYSIYLGYDEWLDYSKRRIINRIITNEQK